MEEGKISEEQIVESKPITHVAVPIENLRNLFDFLKTLEGVSFPDGQEILDIVSKNNINVSMAKDDDIVTPPPIGQDKKE